MKDPNTFIRKQSTCCHYFISYLSWICICVLQHVVVGLEWIYTAIFSLSLTICLSLLACLKSFISVSLYESILVFFFLYYPLLEDDDDASERTAYTFIFIFIFIIQRVKARVIPYPNQPPTRGDNTVSVAHSWRYQAALATGQGI